MNAVDVDVLIVGAGPTGLSAATELRRRGIDRVLVVEREAEAGGIPRHSDHQGFGIRDLHRSLSGPAYARRLTETALRAGVDLRCGTTATLNEAGGIRLTSAAGLEDVATRATLLATGARERPRPARLIPGDRPAGILTTGQLQTWVAAGVPIGRRAVVLGAEHVSYSAVLSLRHAGVTTVAMVTDQSAGQSVRGATSAFRLALHVPLRTRTSIVGLEGRGRLESVILRDLDTGAEERLAADVLITSGDWIPDADLARRLGLGLDPSTRGPRADLGGGTELPGLYAAGNLVHPVETADRCALNGRRAAQHIAASLGQPTDSEYLVLHVTAPLSWAWPNLISAHTLPDRLVLRTDERIRRGRVIARQDERVVGSARLHGGVPNQHSWVDGTLLANAAPGVAVTLELG